VETGGEGLTGMLRGLVFVCLLSLLCEGREREGMTRIRAGSFCFFFLFYDLKVKEKWKPLFYVLFVVCR